MVETLLSRRLSHIKKEITEISSEDALDKMEEGVTIIDVRSAKDWHKGHLPAAVHCDKGMLEVQIEKLIPNVNEELVLYCGGGTRSAFAVHSLQQMGYRNVKSLVGGYRNWIANGYPVETEE